MVQKDYPLSIHELQVAGIIEDKQDILLPSVERCFLSEVSPGIPHTMD
jgi:hypothetical protein